MTDMVLVSNPITLQPSGWILGRQGGRFGDSLGRQRFLRDVGFLEENTEDS